MTGYPKSRFLGFLINSKLRSVSFLTQVNLKRFGMPRILAMTNRKMQKVSSIFCDK
jgi:hypothetical protein